MKITRKYNKQHILAVRGGQYSHVRGGWNGCTTSEHAILRQLLHSSCTTMQRALLCGAQAEVEESVLSGGSMFV